MEKHQLKIQKNARFFLSGNPGPEIRQIWFICHGYGQLGSYFLRNFECIQDGTILFVGCEGLNRFYTTGFSGRVGASWMTKEDREQDIEDYISYLDAVYERVMGMQPDVEHVTAFGFSQGTATISRWLEAGTQKVDRLVLWAGALPEDVDLNRNRERFNAFKNFLVSGTEDEFIQEEDVHGLCKRLDSFQINWKLVRFSGKHEIHADALRRLASI